MMEKMKKLTFLMLCGVLVSISLSTSGCQSVDPLRAFTPKGAPAEEQSFGDYVVRIYDRDGEESSFEILRKGVRVYAAHGYRFGVGSVYEDDKDDSLIRMGTDITGDGKPNLVVNEWTGGSHSDFIFHIFEIGENFRHIQSINAEHSDLVDFENLDEDPALEFPMNDWTFAYWKTCFAQSPAPLVILKYTGTKYEVADQLMRKPGLSPDELNQMAADIREYPDWKEEQPPVELWRQMLDLIYTGNMNQAWVVCDLAWPKGMAGKDHFLDEFKARLSQSPFWTDIRRLNGTNE